MNRKNRSGSKEAIRKPRFQTEWRKSFGFVISIVFLFDLLLSVIASNGYINKWNGDQIYSNIVTSIVQNDLDMTKVKMQDGMIRYIGSNEEEQVTGDDVISKLNYYSSMNMTMNSESAFANICTILMDHAKGRLTCESNPAYYIAYFNSDGVQLANGDGGIELKRTEVSLDRLFAEQKELFAKQMAERHLTMHIEGKKTIQADTFWMEHLVNNLVSNAMKYAKDQSEILILLGDRSFIVKNLFDKELNVPVEQLKEAFVKGDNVRSNEDGNGLGLCIVDQIARAHGYHMNIQVKEHEFIVETLL